MLGPWRPHVQFQAWLEEQLFNLLSQQKAQIKFHAETLEKVHILDCKSFKRTCQTAILIHWSTGCKPTGNPSCLVLASHYKESISRLVQRLKADEVLSLACGFEPENTPGVGTFYDFFNRLWLAHTTTKVLQTPFK